MIDYDDEEVRWWMGEIVYIVSVMESSWREITVESVVRELHDMCEAAGMGVYNELPEMCDCYLQQYSNPFDGLGDVPSDLKILTESGKSDLLKAVTTKSKLYKAHAAELDAYVKAMFGDSVINQTE